MKEAYHTLTLKAEISGLKVKDVLSEDLKDPTQDAAGIAAHCSVTEALQRK